MSRSGSSARQRLDQILVQRGLADSRSHARALILGGRVRSEGRTLDKAGMRFPVDLDLEVRDSRRFVSRGGYKLDAALRKFGVDPKGRDCLDVGASTGGFTQVLLEAGARRVVALDVGRGQLDWTLRQDPRVVALERINARRLEPRDLPFPPSLATLDVAFISLELVLGPVVAVLATDAEQDVIALIKPQFEVGRGQVGRGGIVRDPALHRAAVRRIVDHALARGWGVAGVVASPLTGADGNREFLVHLTPDRQASDPEALDRDLATAIGSSCEREVAR